MKRKFYFILLSLVLFACAENSMDDYHSDHFEIVQLSKSVYGGIHKVGGKAICNIGIVDNGEATFIFDSFLSPKVAEEIPKVVEHYGLSPIKYVVNSHYHNDHIRGNQIFGDEVKIISTKRTKELIEEWEPKEIQDEKEYAPGRFAYFDSLYQSFEGDTLSEEYHNIMMWRPYYEILSKSHEEVKTRLPDTFVDSLLVFDGPEKSIQLISMGPGHTESDLILYLPDDGIVFTGDLVFNECHPYLGNGYLEGLKNWLTFLEGLNVKSVVPGHGNIGSESIISEMTGYLNSLENLADEIILQMKSTEDMNPDFIPEEYKKWQFDQFFPSNMAFIISQKTEE